jgi:TrmH family RNA methyltransferase
VARFGWLRLAERAVGAKFGGRPERAGRGCGGWALEEAGIATNLTSTIRDLKRRRARGRRGLALIEGVRLVEEALAAGIRVVGAAAAPELARSVRGGELRVQLESHAVPVQDVSTAVLRELADTDTPQGIVAVVEPRRWSPADAPLAGGGSATLLVIDGVQDPGNVGTLLRTAYALGVRASIVLRGTADVWGPKTLRAAMGATFRHPILSFDDATFIAWARQHDVTLWATAADGEPLPRALERRGPGVIAIAVGNEGAGIRPHLNAIAAQRVAIPLAQGAESLNVAVAAGILLYEVTRGR